MADLSVTGTSVLAGDNSTRKNGTAGEAIAPGKTVYFNSTSKKWMLADSNSATVQARTATGISLNSAAINQPLEVHTGGDLVLGATLTANTPYFLSDTPGGICPIADVGTGEYLCQIGIAKSTTVLAVNFQSTGVSN